MHDATDQRVVDTGIAVGEENVKADLHRHGLGFQLLSVSRTHRKSALECELWAIPSANQCVPECGFSGSRCDTDAGRTAIDIVGNILRFNVARQCANAVALGLGKQRLVGDRDRKA